MIADNKQFWLMKSEPEVFSIWDLEKKKAPEYWEGVRNYQARNYLKQMKIGDLAWFYHSNCKEPGIYGEMQIISLAEPDIFALDPKSKYFDSKALKKNSWVMVKVVHKCTYKNPITLKFIKSHAVLANMQIAKKGNRLSITPIMQEEWNFFKD